MWVSSVSRNYKKRHERLALSWIEPQSNRDTENCNSIPQIYDELYEVTEDTYMSYASCFGVRDLLVLAQCDAQQHRREWLPRLS